jgi:hypothetical protein
MPYILPFCMRRELLKTEIFSPLQRREVAQQLYVKHPTETRESLQDFRDHFSKYLNGNLSGYQARHTSKDFTPRTPLDQVRYDVHQEFRSKVMRNNGHIAQEEHDRDFTNHEILLASFPFPRHAANVIEVFNRMDAVQLNHQLAAD